MTASPQGCEVTFKHLGPEFLEGNKTKQKKVQVTSATPRKQLGITIETFLSSFREQRVWQRGIQKKLHCYQNITKLHGLASGDHFSMTQHLRQFQYLKIVWSQRYSGQMAN